jgi:hypothetical protein
MVLRERQRLPRSNPYFPKIIFHILQMPFQHFYPSFKWKKCVCGSCDRAENNMYHIVKVLFVNSRDIKQIYNVSEGEIIQEEWFKNCGRVAKRWSNILKP